MLIRKCSQGHDIKLYRNTTPNAVRKKTYADGTVETLTYPPGGYDYFLTIAGKIKKRSDSWKNIEEEYVSQCAKAHKDGHGRVIIGKHKLENCVIKEL